MATPSRPLSVLLFAMALVGSPVRSADSLATVSPFGIGPYAVGCNNVSQDFARLMPGESAEDYWDGNPDGSRPRYVTDLLSDPAHTFDVSVSIPADSELYGSFAGTTIEVVSVICYPTARDNPRPDYPLPTGNSIPHMQQGADTPVWPDATTIFPVLLFSHGLSGSPISSDYIDAIKVFASWGYVVVSPFHGDRRVVDITIENLSDFGYALLHYKDFIAMQALRPLELEATLNAFLTSPEWSARVDPSRIGAFGGSLGGESVLLLGGASLTTKNIILKNTCDACSMIARNGLPAFPSNASAQPNPTETSSTCRTSPPAKALTNVVGMSFIRNSTVPWLFTCDARSTYELNAPASSDFGSMFIPAPGWKK